MDEGDEGWAVLGSKTISWCHVRSKWRLAPVSCAGSHTASRPSSRLVGQDVLPSGLRSSSSSSEDLGDRCERGSRPFGSGWGRTPLCLAGPASFFADASWVQANQARQSKTEGI